MIEETGQPVNQGQAEPQALAGIALRVRDLVELLEDEGLLLVRDAHAGVPDFDAQPAAGRAHPDQHAALPAVGNRIGDQIADHAVEQGGIAEAPVARRVQAQAQALLPGLAGMGGMDAFQQAVERYRLNAGTDGAEVGARHVEQAAEQFLHGADRDADLSGQALLRGQTGFAGQFGREQREGMQRLPQVVTGRSQEAGLRDAGLLGLVPLLFQLGRRGGDAAFQLVAPGLQSGGHFIDAFLEIAQGAGRVRRHARRQIAAADRAHDPLQRQDGQRDGGRQAQGEEDAEQQRDEGGEEGDQHHFPFQPLHAAARHLEGDTSDGVLHRRIFRRGKGVIESQPGTPYLGMKGVPQAVGRGAVPAVGQDLRGLGQPQGADLRQRQPAVVLNHDTAEVRLAGKRGSQPPQFLDVAGKHAVFGGRRKQPEQGLAAVDEGFLRIGIAQQQEIGGEHGRHQRCRQNGDGDHALPEPPGLQPLLLSHSKRVFSDRPDEPASADRSPPHLCFTVALPYSIIRPQ